jgi:hypothetical protein
MNRTEHGLKMAFDPDYEARWTILTLYKKARKREFMDLLKGFCYTIPGYAFCFIFYIDLGLPPWESYIFLILPTTIPIVGAVIYVRDSILFRKKLGI